MSAVHLFMTNVSVNLLKTSECCRDVADVGLCLPADRNESERERVNTMLHPDTKREKMHEMKAQRAGSGFCHHLSGAHLHHAREFSFKNK